MTINLTPIIQAFIALLAAIITYVLVPMIKARTQESDRALLDAAIRAAVYTAEQLFGAGRGEEKMAYALEWLKEQGYDVDSREVEATVYEELNQYMDGHIFASKPPDEVEADPQ